MINLGIPVLNRYDCLHKLITSCEERSTVKPDFYLVIDNGCKFSLDDYPEELTGKISVYRDGLNSGVAKSWNLLINSVWPQPIIISNDDLILAPDTIEKMINNPAPIVFTLGGLNAYSLFLIRDTCVDAVGYFDETISPNYAYFEDNDYQRRVEIAGIKYSGVETHIEHVGSATLKNFTEEERKQHHNKFKTARINYVKKWGGPPGKETFRTPYNR